MKPHHTPLFLAAVAGLGLTGILSGCGGGSSHTAGAQTTTTIPAGRSSSGGSGTPGGTGASGGSGNGGFPGATGSVAQVTGSSMEVQNQQTGQVTVKWTSATAFTKTVALTVSSISTGECVTAIGSANSGHLTATTITVSEPDSSGNCGNGRFGGGGGAGGGGFPGGSPPSGGTPPSRPSGSFPGRGAGFSFANGKVTSVSAASLIIHGISSSGFTPGNQGSSPPTSIQATDVTIAVTSSTRYTGSQSVAASTLAVGDCVTATGSTDSTGAVTARSVRITSTGGQSCTVGFAPPGGTGNA